ncbi:MAG TPA: hypothetical protein DIW61_01105 [Candidatus Aminicenantes bacterium]|nr:hypothetical protein [Candidatus Aminicenantes bacterium]
MIILDATEGCFDGGPVPERPSVIWRESALYFDSDPVALDRVAGSVIGRKRRAAGLADVAPISRHIDTAAAKKLGQGDPGMIEEIVIRL